MSPAADAVDPREPRLSRLQRDLLSNIWVESLEVGLLTAEIPWVPREWFRTWTPANEAAASRALRRLEARGLVERLPARPGGRRTARVRLTDRGWWVASNLSRPT